MIGIINLKRQLIPHLAALLCAIVKLRRCGINNTISHQGHSNLGITEDFHDFFSKCDDVYKYLTRFLHKQPEQRQFLIEQHVILADRNHDLLPILQVNDTATLEYIKQTIVSPRQIFHRSILE